MRTTIRSIKAMKRKSQKIAMVTAYDATSAAIVERAGIPVVLVGDSLGNVMLGHGDTLPVTMDDMVHHVRAVVRGTEKAHVVADLPFMSYQASVEDAVRNSGRMLQEGGAQSVKLEGGERLAGTVERIVGAGIPVMGHIGFTPQSVNQIGGYRVQGKTSRTAEALVEDALALESAGAYSLVLELMAAPVARMITERLSIPTIGIGAGVHCDGQVQVLHDMLGLGLDFKPRHARQYADLSGVIRTAMTSYADDVRAGSFPSDAESFFSNESAVRDGSATPSQTE
jgi:3-methyl-2-oxobutanoate hydroxymethyltransferase